jgi:hypothetical protein
MFNIVIGTAVQTALVALPIYIVLRRFDGIAACIALVAAGGAISRRAGTTGWRRTEWLRARSGPAGRRCLRAL